MKTLALALVALAGVATAAPNYAGMPQTRGRGSAGSAAYGDVTTNPTYATQAAVNLYVDPTGSDSNPCTSTGTAACLTLQGAENKIPKLVRHPVTVTVAAGNYAGLGVYGHTFDPATAAAGAYINYVGTLANFAPATGTATGTASAGSAGSATGPTFGTLTDATQTWTVNNLRGALLVTTGGTGSGQVKAINSNTSTVVTIAGTFSPAPDATTTYAIQTPSSIVTTSLNQSAFPDVAAGTARGIIVQANQQTRDSATGGTVQLTNMGISGAFTSMTVQNSVAYLKNCVFSTSVAGGVAVNVSTGGQVNTLGSSFTNTTTGITLNMGAQSGGALPNGGGTFSNSVFVATTGPAIDIAASGVTLSGVGVTTTGAAVNAVQMSGGVGGHAAVNLWVTGVLITCGNSSTTGIAPIVSNAMISPQNATITGSTITGCGTGISAVGPTFISVGHQGASGVTLVGPGSGTGLSATLGGRLYVIGTTTSFATFTNETSVDGTAQTLATILALTPPVQNSNYGSWIGR